MNASSSAAHAHADQLAARLRRARDCQATADCASCRSLGRDVEALRRQARALEIGSVLSSAEQGRATVVREPLAGGV